MRKLSAVFLALALVSAKLATAQQPTSAPSDSAELRRMMGMFNQMGPMYETMTQAMIDGTIKALSRQETIDRLAQFSRRYYEALMKQGFTKEEALQIVAGAGAGVAGVRGPR